MAREVEHYLVTLYLEDGYFHAYIMTNDHRQVLAVVDRMMATIEKGGVQLLMPIVLETRLGDAVDVVRGIVCKNMPEAAKTMAEATDCHFTAFVMSAEHPDNASLMELH